LKIKIWLWIHSQKNIKNISSPILVNCKEGHRIETNLKTIRRTNFRCPVCEGESSTGLSTPNPQSVPPKKGYRIIGIDNATQSFGLSIFESGKLIYYTLLTFSGDTTARLNAIRDAMENMIIPVWEPDFVQFEDVQLQGQGFGKGFKTYEVLVKLVGLLEMSCARFGIRYSKVRSNIWRSNS